MLDRRTLVTRGGAAMLGAMAITAVANGTAWSQADTTTRLTPDPAVTPVPNPPLSPTLTAAERTHLVKFDELDFQIFSHEQWARIGESHARNIRVHWPDGHMTDGIDRHIADLQALFVWAPDTHVSSHYLRIAKDNLTAVCGVMAGTFTRPMPNGTGGFIAPTGKKYSINMSTVGIWNSAGTMDEEFLYWDDRNFFSQIGLG